MRVEFSNFFSTMESTLEKVHDKITVTGKPVAVIFLSKGKSGEVYADCAGSCTDHFRYHHIFNTCINILFHYSFFKMYKGY